MRLPTLRRILFCLILSMACSHALAAQSRQMDADGSNADCPDTTASSDNRSDEANPEPQPAAPSASRTQKPRASATATPRSRAPAPRWHSFLPGMIR
ncbi:MAG: hypothetical protein QM612_11255 [Thermomonas sp.]|uniref:hypothetical protein n=1 Tax=Thermomonas sp. TaxID=1971895 RepID=UPI0039E5F2C8